MSNFNKVPQHSLVIHIFQDNTKSKGHTPYASMYLMTASLTFGVFAI